MLAGMELMEPGTWVVYTSPSSGCVRVSPIALVDRAHGQLTTCYFVGDPDGRFGEWLESTSRGYDWGMPGPPSQRMSGSWLGPDDVRPATPEEVAQAQLEGLGGL